MIKERRKTGFAALAPERQREISRMGGKSQGRHNNPGNFANDPVKARIAAHTSWANRRAR